MKKNIEVYDLECLKNLFTYTGYNYKEDIWYQYVICPWRNDIKELLEHLNSISLMIGYNNEGYDYPLLHHLINHKDLYLFRSGYEISQALYSKSQEIIDMEFSAIADKNKFIHQLDLFKIWHYNNNARSTSLKDLEVAMRMENVEEMPIHHSHWCKEGDEIPVLEYNKNDVYATYQFLMVTLGRTEFPLYKGKDKIKLRTDMHKMFGLPCENYPDVKIGEQLILNLYSQKVGMTPWKVKQIGGSPRESINLKDCIPYWANFETPVMQGVKKKFEETTITELKGSFENHIIFHGIQVDYGTGGVHACCEPGVYDADDEWMILDEDVGLTKRLN